MSAAVFFFCHSLIPPRGGTRSPGRFAYNVRGRAIDLRKKTLANGWSGIVYGDGFGPNTPGPNIDPNILADVLPWHLSFCRLDSRQPSHCVGGTDPTDRVLSEVVKTGDLVLFGQQLSAHVVCVDTVMCVDQLAHLPQRGGTFTLSTAFDQYWRSLRQRHGEMTWSSFQQTRVFLLNLRDACPGGSHAHTHLLPHHQIVGRRSGENVSTCPEDLRAALASGNGFNFIPLRGSRASANEAIRQRPGIFTARIPNLGRLVTSTKSRVWKLPSDLRDATLDALVADADCWALDPLIPSSRLTPRHA